MGGMTDRRQTLGGAGLALLFVFCLGSSSRAQGVGHASTCAALADLRIENTNLLSAAVVPADGDLPEYCRVLGYVRPAINFETRLPTKGWNGRFYMAGCGGGCGAIKTEGLDLGVTRSYAASTTDGGHWGDGPNTLWGFHNPRAEIDYAYRAVHETTRVSKHLIEVFYSREPERSYFDGCSNGGRQGNMAAWRYPEDFDGILSGAPGLDFAGTFGILGVWIHRTNSQQGGQPILTDADIPIIQAAVYERCDAADGLRDGLIDDPRECSFDPSSLLCGNNDAADCFSSAKVDTLRAWYDGPRNSAGERLFPGIPLGSEPYWGLWLTGTAESRPELPAAAWDVLAYLSFPDDPGEAFDLDDFELDRAPERLEHAARLYNADNTDLEAFRKRGGKLLMYHGWADALVVPQTTVQYYEVVEERIGSRAETQDFLRLFMIPGRDHCGVQSGPGVDGYFEEALNALERWVEEGRPPESLLTAKRDADGEILWTRPVCPYPQRARYKGAGSVDEASSFECVDVSGKAGGVAAKPPGAQK